MLADSFTPLTHSPLLSARTRAVLDDVRKREEAREQLQQKLGVSTKDVAAYRAFSAEHYYAPLLSCMLSKYRVCIQPDTIAGVKVWIVEPETRQVRPERVLINFHGGGFVFGGGDGGLLEAIPVAAKSHTRVIAVDYRLAPEHVFPAASVDSVSVYAECLKHYRANRIGLFGGSVGALLTAQTLASLGAQAIELPGAAGMFFGGAGFWSSGDSGCWRPMIDGSAPLSSRENPYLKTADEADPLAFPLVSADVLRSFPPCLLITATRDAALSSVAHTHARLSALGVAVELHVWEGLGHAFFYEADLPESDEAYARIADFFERRL